MIDEFLGVFCLTSFKDFVTWGAGVFFALLSFLAETDCFSSETLDTGRTGVLKTGSSTFSDRFFFGSSVSMDLETERLGVFFIFFSAGEFTPSVVDFTAFGWTDLRLVAAPLTDCVMETSAVCDVLDEGLDGGDFGPTDLRFTAVFFGIAVSVLVVGLFLPVTVTFLVWEQASCRVLPFWYTEDLLVRVVTPGGESTLPGPFFGFSWGVTAMVSRIPPFLLSTLKMEDRRDLVPIGEDLTGSGSLNKVCLLEFVGF